MSSFPIESNSISFGQNNSIAEHTRIEPHLIPGHAELQVQLDRCPNANRATGPEVITVVSTEYTSRLRSCGLDLVDTRHD